MQIKVLSSKVKIGILLFLAVIALLCSSFYPTTVVTSLIFNISWLSLFAIMLFRPKYYTFFWGSLFLFLGFWVKFHVYMLPGGYIVEPVGNWLKLQIKPWDRVLIVSSVAALGLICSYFMASVVFPKLGQKFVLFTKNISSPPTWYKKYRIKVWALTFLVVLFVSIINFKGRILFTGLAPRWILPFHLNILIVWGMVFVLPFILASYIYWEGKMVEPAKSYILYFLAMFMAAIIAISTLSRAYYVFWTVPMLFVVIKDLKNFKEMFPLVKHYWKLIAFYLLIFVATLFIVMGLRFHYYSGPSKSKATVSYFSTSGNTIHVLRFITQIDRLFVGRWVGLEGVMATTAYKHADSDFFKKALVEKPSSVDTGIYNSKIIRYRNKPGFMASSLPGIVGILNYTHSLPIIFSGMFLVMLLLTFLEVIVAQLTKYNPYYLSVFGFLVGYWCMSGLNIPYLGLVNLLEYMGATFLIAILCLKLKKKS